VRRYDELLARLRSAAVEVVEDEALTDVKRCYVFDPWGNRIELLAVDS
jgi:hypothetical protein